MCRRFDPGSVHFVTPLCGSVYDLQFSPALPASWPLFLKSVAHHRPYGISDAAFLDANIVHSFLRRDDAIAHKSSTILTRRLTPIPLGILSEKLTRRGADLEGIRLERARVISAPLRRHEYVFAVLTRESVKADPQLASFRRTGVISQAE
jgi:hypothetical protein